MSQSLPPHLLQLFQPRENLPYLPPLGKLPYEKAVANANPDQKAVKFSGIGRLLHVFEQAKETPSAPLRSETREERRERKRKEREEALQYKLERDLAMWEVKNTTDPRVAAGDPYRTLFVGRISFETTEAKLRREFETYGTIKSIRILHDTNTGKSRGYGFIEYEEEKAMHEAYKLSDGLKIDGHRIKVDIERGRTIKGWKPQRLGGGFGGRRARAKGENPNKKSTTQASDSSSKPTANGDDRSGRSGAGGRDRDDRGGGDRDRDNNRSRDRDNNQSDRSSSSNRRYDGNNNRGGNDRSNGADYGGGGRSDQQRFSYNNKDRQSSRPIDFAPPPARAGGAAFGGGGDQPMDVDNRRRSDRPRSRSREGTIGGRYSRDESQQSYAGGGNRRDNSNNFDGGGGGGYREKRRGGNW